jgi:hypothetical protein
VNGRKKAEETPEGRIAAVAESLRREFEKAYRERGNDGPTEPDYADFREALRPYIHREMVVFAIKRVRKSSAKALTDIVKELAEELRQWEIQIKD